MITEAPPPHAGTDRAPTERQVAAGSAAPPTTITEAPPPHGNTQQAHPNGKRQPEGRHLAAVITEAPPTEPQCGPSPTERARPPGEDRRPADGDHRDAVAQRQRRSVLARTASRPLGAFALPTVITETLLAQQQQGSALTPTASHQPGAVALPTVTTDTLPSGPWAGRPSDSGLLATRSAPLSLCAAGTTGHEGLGRRKSRVGPGGGGTRPPARRSVLGGRGAAGGRTLTRSRRTVASTTWAGWPAAARGRRPGPGPSPGRRAGSCR